MCNRLGSSDNGGLCLPGHKTCDCKPGVGGVHCDRCLDGFWGLHRLPQLNLPLTEQSFTSGGCLPCNCNAYGSLRADCEQMNGQCICKHGVKETQCDQCELEQQKLTESGCVAGMKYIFIQKLFIKKIFFNKILI